MPIGNSRSAVEYAEKKTQECNDKELKQKDIIEKYEDKMLDLKEELIKTRKALPLGINIRFSIVTFNLLIIRF